MNEEFFVSIFAYVFMVFIFLGLPIMFWRSRESNKALKMKELDNFRRMDASLAGVNSLRRNYEYVCEENARLKRILYNRHACLKWKRVTNERKHKPRRRKAI